ncbi:DUF397 domain-containing protein [Saccharopolyspora sp. HNM0983]|uniref:DUF397 domain-containing protein n=1 Tax=Saccharopolyspora montiporae TaxID=2781240 RepID=A0A929B8D9_9PSEU|nr:DUF397 domain-containing protein [Saccharopolyspora sp. HNM0983]MBE9375122.1 DUF397 domain-containing protein [Saccharopolyspora sp. HNM0983]
MSEIQNGVPAQVLSDVAWRKSRYSGAVGNCVEVASLIDGGIAVRNSRFPDGPALVYTREEIAAFVHGAKDGEFDDLIA